MWIYIAFLALIVGYVVVTYNAFIGLRIRGRNAWADIDVQLKRRHDLVPNLVATVEGYAAHEKGVFENVTRLRSQAMGLQGAEQTADTEAQLSTAIKSIFAVAESYPALKADQNFRDLQTQLAEIENNIQSARRYYNAVVRDFNTKRELFPSNIIGGIFGFGRLPYFQIDDDERQPVSAKFS
ncbi:MAG TPA: LemA family protein [Armatimonadota bacterium]|jgi:LemA protein